MSREITAKIIRHRWRYIAELNDTIKSVDEETYFKIVFSDPYEMQLWKEWVEKRGGEYNYNKDLSKQEGKMPEVKDIFGDEEFCWCDTMTWYLANVAHYRFHSIIASPYKGEIYTKEVVQ